MFGPSRLTCLLMTAVIVAVCLGCSGGGNPDVVTPGLRDNLIGDADSQPRIVLGAYNVLIDEYGEVAVTQLRTLNGHHDVTDFLFPPNCWDCFQAVVLEIDGNRWDFGFSLRNPTSLTGYDVRANLLELGDIELATEPDSFTEYFAFPDDPDPRNPFFIFDSANGQNEWAPLSTGSRDVSFVRPDGTSFSEIVVVIDASFPVNQLDPTIIDEIDFTQPFIYTDGSNTTDLSARVHVWSGDADTVTIDLTPIGGAVDATLALETDGYWHLKGISCATGIEPGVKEFWITAANENESIYNRTSLSVQEHPTSYAEWTMMLYLHAANLPDDEDINELEMSGSIDGKLNLIVLWDKPLEDEEDVIVYVQHDETGYNLDLVSDFIDEGGQVIPDGGLDMADPETLENFMLWTMANYPANHYILDLWDHGAGIFASPEKPVPFRNVCGGLTLWQIRDVCQTVLDAQDIVDKIDIIGFDVCHLGWMETAYCLKDVTDIVIASQNGEPGPGWDYGPPFINLRDNIDTYTAAELAYDIVEYYLISYSDPTHPYHYPASDCTQAACDIDRVVDLAVPALNDFCETSIGYLPEYHDAFEQCLDETAYWGWELTDIGHYATVVSESPLMPTDVKTVAADLAQAVEDAMIHHGHTNGVPDEESGWDIWFPPNIADAWENYLMEYTEPGYLEFYETMWDEFLYAYADELPVTDGWLVIEELEFLDLTGGDGDGVFEPNEIIDLYITAHNTGDSTANNVHVYLNEAPGYESVYSIIQDEQWYTDIPSGDTGTNAQPFRIKIENTAQEGDLAFMRTDLTCNQSETLNQPISFIVSQGQILIIDQEYNSGAALTLETAIEASGYTADVMQVDLDAAPMNQYTAVFITLGMSDWVNGDYIPDQDDIDAVQAYLDSGHPVYIESGDLWFYFPFVGYPDISPSFGISADADGIEDLITEVHGESGTILDGMEFEYDGDSTYPDHIDASGAGAYKVMSAHGETWFGSVVAYDSGVYRTVGSSFEFGGLVDGTGDNTKVELMSRLLTWLGL